MIWELVFAPFVEFGFMRRALLGCVAVSFGATPVGVFLMLRRMSLTGDAMAHAILPGAAIGYLISGLSLSAMTIGGLIAGMVVALTSGFVARVTAITEDASLAAFYLISLAVGVLIVSTRGSNVDLLHVLFGSVLALDDAALILLCSFATLSILTLAVLLRPLVLECVDPQFLRSVSRLSAITHFLFLALVVINLVAGFHALGTLMSPLPSAAFSSISPPPPPRTSTWDTPGTTSVCTLLPNCCWWVANFSLVQNILPSKTCLHTSTRATCKKGWCPNTW